MVCYADDCVCLVQYENEAQKFYQLMTERLKKFGLEVKKWIWGHMRESIPGIIKALNVKLTGHYRYYGI